MDRLLPCPFCGCEARTTETARSGNRWGVACDCGASVRFYSTEAEAVEAWNARHVETCHNDAQCDNDFVCSVCGDSWSGFIRGAFCYCPNCGGKVVGTDD